MPIYEYQCQQCGHGLEAIQRLSDAPLTRCPACDRDTLKKQLSAPSFRLSGGGWYETDFKTGDKRNLAGDGGQKGSGDKSGSESGSSGSGSGKSETTASASKSDASPAA